jgi:hypothetical protein
MPTTNTATLCGRQRPRNALLSQSMDWLAIIRDLGWACAIALLIAIAVNYVAALL